MGVAVIRSGMLDTFQDQGRYGYASWGINPTGVMDHYASRIANFLVGNEAGATVLEMTFPAAELEFTTAALITITGADFSPQLNSKDIPLWQPIVVTPGSRLRFHKRKWGTWAYISVQGGFQCEPWLGSGSTHLKIQAGGFQGRRLQKGDFLPTSAFHTDLAQPKIGPFGFYHPATLYDPVIYLLSGAEGHLMNATQVSMLEQTGCGLSISSDRMGYYIADLSIELNLDRELVSKGVSFGSMQVLPSGKPLILMADHQTTGGYPVVANVIHASLPALSQMVPGKTFHFKMMDQAFAEALDSQREKMLVQFKQQVKCKLQELCVV